MIHFRLKSRRRLHRATMKNKSINLVCLVELSVPLPKKFLKILVEFVAPDLEMGYITEHTFIPI